MKLVTFQTIDAVKDLFKKGYLETDETKIDVKKLGTTYLWILDKMNEKVANPDNTKYPLWCWVKCYNGICPAKRKGKKVRFSCSYSKEMSIFATCIDNKNK